MSFVSRQAVRLFFLSLLIVFSSSHSSYAGLGVFTNFQKFEDWLIEKKIDPETNEISCRASMPKHGSWFGARVRLDSQDVLVFPEYLSIQYIPKQELIQRILKGLERCRSSFF